MLALLILAVAIADLLLAFKFLMMKVFRVGPLVDQLPHLFDVAQPIATKVEMNSAVIKAVMEAVDDVTLREVDASGLLLEESADVAPLGLVLLLLALSEIKVGPRFLPCALEVVNKLFAQVIPVVDGVRFVAFQLCEWRLCQGDREVGAHCICASPGSFDGLSVNA